MSAADRGPKSFWTWGHRSDEPTEAQRADVARSISKRYGVDVSPPKIPRLEDIELRAPRLKVPNALIDIVTTAHDERIRYTYGGHSLELLKAVRGDYPNPTDAVAHPINEEELERVLDWCNRERHAAVPYGGGTSVVWGVSPPPERGSVVTIALDRLNRVLEVDDISRAARIQAGILGPDLEDALRPHGFTLRHFPQSFPWSTLGGWIVTRSGGHYATNHTHIDDFVESTRMLTPMGWWESRRLPGSGAGPSPDRIVLGSEGTLGIVTEAWMRIQARPRFRATAGVRFVDSASRSGWEACYTACRRIVQAKLWPANLRILDPAEAQRGAGLDGKTAFLIIGFESAEIALRAYIDEAVKIARDAGGIIDDEEVLVADGSGEATGRSGAAGAWRSSFIGVNAGLTHGLGLVSDTFETAITWDRWPAFDARVRRVVGGRLEEVFGNAHSLSCRFTHVYTDGPAPYYTWSGYGRIGAEQEQWQAIKDAANDALIAGGGTITHHHAVGRMHRAAWEKQRPKPFGDALRALKRSVDPYGILNPGVLIDP
jgi:alkyldihydroxyacetonephosphate synthase